MNAVVIQSHMFIACLLLVSDEKSKLMLRLPNGNRKQLNIPCSSKFMVSKLVILLDLLDYCCLISGKYWPLTLMPNNIIENHIFTLFLLFP